MIIGIGNDLCDIRRIEAALARYGARFENRCFTGQEQAIAHARADMAATYARRFAAKEACAKALGTGFRGLSWQEITVVSLPSGQPYIELTGAAQARLEAITPSGYTAVVHLALTDEPPLAQAVVLIEALRESEAVLLRETVRKN